MNCSKLYFSVKKELFANTIGSIVETLLYPKLANSPKRDGDLFKYNYQTNTELSDLEIKQIISSLINKPSKVKIININIDDYDCTVYNPNGQTHYGESADGYRGAGWYRGGYERSVQTNYKMVVEVIESANPELLPNGSVIRVLGDKAYFY